MFQIPWVLLSSRLQDTGKVWSCLRFLFDQSQSPSYSTRWGKKNPWLSVTKGSVEICGNSILFLCRMACSTLVLFSFSPKTEKICCSKFWVFWTVSKPRFVSLNNHHPTKRISEWPHDLVNFIHLKHISIVSIRLNHRFFKAFQHYLYLQKNTHMLENNQIASKTNRWTDSLLWWIKLYLTITLTKHSTFTSMDQTQT